MSRHLPLHPEVQRELDQASLRPFRWDVPLAELLAVSRFKETYPLPAGFRYEEAPPCLLAYYQQHRRWPSGLVYSLKRPGEGFRSVRLGMGEEERPLTIPIGTIIRLDVGRLLDLFHEEPLRSLDWHAPGSGYNLIEYIKGMKPPETGLTVAIAVSQHESVPVGHVLCYGR